MNLNHWSSSDCIDHLMFLFLFPQWVKSPVIIVTQVYSASCGRGENCAFWTIPGMDGNYRDKLYSWLTAEQMSVHMCRREGVHQGHWCHYQKGVWPFIKSLHQGMEISKILSAKKLQSDGTLNAQEEANLPKLRPGSTTKIVVSLMIIKKKHVSMSTGNYAHS